MLNIQNIFEAVSSSLTKMHCFDMIGMICDKASMYRISGTV